MAVADGAGVFVGAGVGVAAADGFGVTVAAWVGVGAGAGVSVSTGVGVAVADGVGVSVGTSLHAATTTAIVPDNNNSRAGRLNCLQVVGELLGKRFEFRSRFKQSHVRNYVTEECCPVESPSWGYFSQSHSTPSLRGVLMEGRPFRMWSTYLIRSLAHMLQ